MVLLYISSHSEEPVANIKYIYKFLFLNLCCSYNLKLWFCLLANKLDPKFPEKSEPDPKEIISDPQHCPKSHETVAFLKEPVPTPGELPRGPSIPLPSSRLPEEAQLQAKAAPTPCRTPRWDRTTEQKGWEKIAPSAQGPRQRQETDGGRSHRTRGHRRSWTAAGRRGEEGPATPRLSQVTGIASLPLFVFNPYELKLIPGPEISPDSGPDPTLCFFLISVNKRNVLPYFCNIFLLSGEFFIICVENSRYLNKSEWYEFFFSQLSL